MIFTFNFQFLQIVKYLKSNIFEKKVAFGNLTNIHIDHDLYASFNTTEEVNTKGYMSITSRMHGKFEII